MEAIQPPKLPLNRDRGHSDSFPTRPRTSHRESSTNGGGSQSADENRSPANMPKALSTMLKTTTETGDIGMFSIKPPRVPPSSAMPRRIGGAYSDMGGVQRPRPSFQPYGVPKVDDRRRLPSYSRDTTSESLSTYDTASQKSGSLRIAEEPDHRSYSMTQTSYSAYALSNHRSFTSLRSQPDMIGLGQRPRSPFAYPSRLKRPGFRPSSPALTDGGGIDYRRRAEIERMPYAAGYNTSSPSSLYADRRKPPLALRPEGNRSTPWLLSQPSPPRRSSTPHTLRSNGHQGNDWYRRNGPASVNTSPARSTFSLASTSNIYQNHAPPSTTTTPGKVHPPSPLYYDYTEDFDVDDYNHGSETIDPPPQFCIEQTIPEHVPEHAEQLPPPEVENRLNSNVEGLQKENSGTPALQNSPKDIQHNSEESQPTTKPPRSESEIQIMLSEQEEDAQQGRKTIRLSGLGRGARELSSHVEEAFGLLSCESFEILISNTGDEAAAEGSMEHGPADQVQNHLEVHLKRTSSHRLTSSPSVISTSPLDLSFSTVPARLSSRGDSQRQQSTDSSWSRKSTPYSLPSNVRVDTRDDRFSNSDQSELLSTSAQTRVRSSGFYSIDADLTELAQLINTYEDKNDSHLDESSMASVPPARTPMISPSIPDQPLSRSASSNHSSTPTMSSFNSQKTESSHRNSQAQPSKQSQRHQRGRNLPQLSEDEPIGQIPNFSHQIPHKAISRSESPMLAPKPISPARQLKLRNSIPQIMKALPPAPPEVTLSPMDSPLDCESSSYKAGPSRFSGYASDSRDTPVLELWREISSPVEVTDDRKIPYKGQDDIIMDSTERMKPIGVDDEIDIAHVMPRLKLKMRAPPRVSPLSIVKTSSPDEDQPWPERKSIAPTTDEASNDLTETSKPPRFKLKVTRATNSTMNSVGGAAEGTVRINRESRESVGLQFHNPKDLFTPSSGGDNTFRQVNKHRHSRRESVASSSAGDAVGSTTATRSNPTTMSSVEPTTSHSPLKSSNALSPPEARSVFSDDSSYGQEHRSLRNRLSNLKNRIAAPYGTRTGTQSYDDITWKDRNGAEVPTPSATRSIPNLQGNRASTEAKPMRRFAELIHRQKLKAKLRGWLRGARAALSARAKPRGSAPTGDAAEV